MAPDWHRADLCGGVRRFQRAAPGLGLCGVLWRNLFLLFHCLHHARHCLLGHDPFSRKRRRGAGSVHLPGNPLCGGGQHIGGHSGAYADYGNPHSGRQRPEGLRTGSAYVLHHRPGVSLLHHFRRPRGQKLYAGGSASGQLQEDLEYGDGQRPAFVDRPDFPSAAGGQRSCHGRPGLYLYLFCLRL